MSLLQYVGLIALLLVGQASAFATEVAVLSNGFTLSFDRKEQIGAITRLFRGNGYVDVQTSAISSFTADDPAPAPQPVSDAATALSESDLNQMVADACKRNQLDPDFVRSVIQVESNFKVTAVSRKGALGLMQLMPRTAELLGVSDPMDPKANIEAGTRYLSDLLDRYHNDPIKALAAYNAGAERVHRYHGVPPYVETRAYVARIMREFNARKRAKAKAAGKTSHREIRTARVTKPANPA